MSQPPFGGNKSASLPQGLRDTRRHFQIHLIDVTPGPPFAGLEGGHHRMGRAREMFRGMVIGRAVTTPDMTAGQAETEMHPGRSNLQAFFTS
jgi:hypothetical protein